MTTCEGWVSWAKQEQAGLRFLQLQEPAECVNVAACPCGCFGASGAGSLPCWMNPPRFLKVPLKSSLLARQGTQNNLGTTTPESSELFGQFALLSRPRGLSLRQLLVTQELVVSFLATVYQRLIVHGSVQL